MHDIKEPYHSGLYSMVIWSNQKLQNSESQFLASASTHMEPLLGFSIITVSYSHTHLWYAYNNGYTPVFMIRVHHWPKELLIWHCTVLSLGQLVQLIMIVLSLTALIGSRCSLNGAHTNHCWANLPHASKCTKNSASHTFRCPYYNLLYSSTTTCITKTGTTLLISELRRVLVTYRGVQYSA